MFEREYRDLSHVPRWGIIPVIKRQTVAEHSYYVTLYIHHICLSLGISGEILLNALRHGLEHDRSECYTSDIPGPVKRNMMNPDKEKFYELKEDTRRFTVEKYETDKVAVAIRKLADLMDEYAYWVEEGMLGNVRHQHMLRVVRTRLMDASEKVAVLTKNALSVTKMMTNFYNECQKVDKVVPQEPKK